MKFLDHLRHFGRRHPAISAPGALLIALLQRTPVLPLAGGAGDLAAFAPAGDLVRSAVALTGAFGALHTLAGATTYSLITTQTSPDNLTVNTPMSQVGFTVSNTIGIGSWNITGTIPPGLKFTAQEGGNTLTAPGVLDATTPGSSDGYGGSTGGNSQTTPVLSGTPTQAGTYTINLQAFEYGANTGGSLAGLSSPVYSYTVVVAGSTPAAVAPSFTIQPVSASIASNTTVVFGVAATGTPAPSYQWLLNNAPISGATSPRLVLSGATSANAGNYSCVATNGSGSVTSTVATLGTVPTTDPGRLGNLSVLTQIQGTLTVGFVIGGTGTSGLENLLVRATGPALAAFGTKGTLPDPTLTVIQQSNSTTLSANSGWGSNQTAVDNADNATGAFPLTNPASLDSALVIPLPSAAGGYTVQVSGKSGDSGQALTELYDNTANYTLTTPRLVNLSCRTLIAAGGSLSTGFVIGGNTSKTLLVRASGPALVPFGVTGVMPDPQIVVQPLGATTVLAANAGWGGDAQITSVANSVSAFPYTNSASLDSAVVVTLAPGSYTAQVSSVSGAAGTVLVEVYEVP